MNVAKRAVGLITALCLFQFSLPAKEHPVDPTSVKHRAREFGLGADVKLNLADGNKLRGRVEALRDESFVLLPKPEGPSRELRYGDVTEIRLARVVFRADGSPDPLEVRRVALALDVGKHVMTKVAGGKTLRGHIESIQADHFVLRLDHDAGSVQIPYQEVLHLEQNLSMGAKIAIIVAIAASVALIIFVEWFEHYLAGAF